jgi:hypothetical protein
MNRARRTLSAMAVVMGDVDLVRALGLAGIGSAFFGIPDATARFSRHVRRILPAIEGWEVRSPSSRHRSLGCRSL